MKKLILAILTGIVLLGVTPTKAAVTSTNSTTGEVFTLLTTGGKVIDYITVVPAGTNVITRIYDLPDTYLVYTNTAYTNFVTYVTNQVNTFVTTTGITNSWTNTVKYVDVYTVAASTNNSYTPVATYATPSASIGTFTDRLVLNRGLTISNNVAATVIVGYRDQ